MTPAEWGLVIAAVAVTLHFLKWMPTVASLGIFLGIILVGINGKLVLFASRLLEFVGRFVGSVGAYLFGVSATVIGVVIVVVLGVILIRHWSTKAKRSTFWLAGIMAVIIAAGATGIAALNNLPTDLQTGITQTTSGSGLTGSGVGG